MKLKKHILILCLALTFISIMIAHFAGSVYEEQVSDLSPLPVEDEMNGECTLYTSIEEEQIYEIIKAFNKLYPHIKINVVSSNTGNLITKLSTELQIGEFNADVLWFDNISYFLKLKEMGMLKHYESPYADDLLYRFKQYDNMFIIASLSIVGFVYNKHLIGPNMVPQKWTDLLSTNLKNNIAMPDLVSSGAMLYTVSGWLDDPLYGDSFLTQLNKNGMDIETSSISTIKRVCSGDAMIGIAEDYLAKEYILKGEPIKFVYPLKNLPQIPTPLAISSMTKNPKASELFYDFLISEKGQQVIADQQIIPVLNQLRPKVTLSLLEVKKRELEVDEKNLIKNKNTISDIFNYAFHF